MAIDNWEQTPRSDGYTGIRVTWKENGKLKQRYFPRGKLKQAQAFDKRMRAKYAAPSRSEQVYRYTAPRYDPPRRTGIVGINMQFSEQRRTTPWRYYPGFSITHQDKVKGIRHNNARLLKRDRDLEQTWRESCRLLAQYRGLKRVPSGWYAACPSAKDFEKLRKWYNQHQGKQISKSNMLIFDGERA